MTSINERISLIVNDLFKGNVSAFCREIGIKQPTMNTILGSRQSKPSYEVLNAIASSKLNISSDWLLTGNGEMFNSENDSVKIGIKEKEIIFYVDENGFLKLKNSKL